MKNKALKQRIIELSYKHGLSHIGSCITAVDIIDEIYANKKPNEKFVLSAGHAHIAHLVVREKYEGIDPDELIKQNGIHCDRSVGCDVSTGSLGNGIGIAVGMALADRSKDVYCLLSDGECAEGSVYEAFNVMRREGLYNLKVYINANGWGAYREAYVNEFFEDQDFDTQIVQTNMYRYPKYLQGQMGHYKALNEEEFNEVMELLK